ncbi:uncharacterized protein ColSpa_12350 [Colletotrichum spaethianum]|uniref:Uncharacterized protein n=1 Tax=Colletotrichum spaethianum TaxID=700344 RepID=A0AA37UL37_9PEZI|nr:uncharacterized protein ColSpa_12350 [Colletotrichum spaethianum]GKT52169.1 hypothetical protein ColSpa_12350 [Colletotrichum spaethianum]
MPVEVDFLRVNTTFRAAEQTEVLASTRIHGQDEEERGRPSLSALGDQPVGATRACVWLTRWGQSWGWVVVAKQRQEETPEHMTSCDR